MGRMRLYFKSKAEAIKARDERNKRLCHARVEINKMTWGRHKGCYYVGTYMEWLNFAN